MKILFDGEEVANDLTVMNVVDENGQQVGYRRLTTEEQVAYDLKNSKWDADTSNRMWVKLREMRNTLLDATDWWSLADSPAMSAAQAVYRQALRDLPASTENPAAPVWPVL